MSEYNATPAAGETPAEVPSGVGYSGDAGIVKGTLSLPAKNVSSQTKAKVESTAPAPEHGKQQHELAEPIDESFDYETPLREAMKKCEQEVQGGGFLTKQKSEVKTALALSYEVYRSLVRGGKAAINMLVGGLDYLRRDRALQKGKPSLLALYAAVCPEEQGDRDWCYEKAYYLEHAQDQGVSVADFPDWLQTTPAMAAKKAIRDKRKLESPAKAKPKEPKTKSIQTLQMVPTDDDNVPVTVTLPSKAIAALKAAMTDDPNASMSDLFLQVSITLADDPAETAVGTP